MSEILFVFLLSNFIYFTIEFRVRCRVIFVLKEYRISIGIIQDKLNRYAEVFCLKVSLAAKHDMDYSMILLTSAHVQHSISMEGSTDSVMSAS